MMKLIELILDESMLLTGIDAISLVEYPAIEEDFIALNTQRIEFATQSDEKHILMGAALVPNKPIYRAEGQEEFYVYFSEATIRKASEMFFQKSKQNNATLEHEVGIQGLTVVESWIVEDEVHDKSRKYGFDLPVGTWMVSMKVNNPEIWTNFVKTGKVKGFSIEGYFVDKLNLAKQEMDILMEQEAALMLSQIVAIIKRDGRRKSGTRTEMESFSDYPDAVKNNAKRGIEYNEKVGNKCATPVGKIRAQQLAQGKPVSVETITRMYSFLSRAEEYYDEGNNEACGTISFLLWGGLAGKRWAESKLKELGKLELAVGVPHYTADGKLYTGPTHKDADGKLMTGAEHTEDSEYLYHKEDLAEVGPRGGVRKSDKAPKSDTPNKDPKGEGTAKGKATTTRGAEVPKAVEEILQKKADEWNEKYKEKRGYGANIGALKTVYQRGVGAFNQSHSPAVRSQQQWALARVNAFLYLLKNGRPENAKYIGDYDLLPEKHPKSSK